MKAEGEPYPKIERGLGDRIHGSDIVSLKDKIIERILN